jgi:hypothetical protein
MKKALVAAILGIATATSVFAQGQAAIGNYVTAPYNQVVWGNGPLAGTGVIDTSVQLQVWFGAGVVSDATTLQPGVIFHINPSYTFAGAAGTGGYYDTLIQALPTTGAYTFQLRASGAGVDSQASVSALWQPDGINSSSLPAVVDSHSIGFQVFTPIPEPTTLALAGLGSAALLIFRRRK